MVMIRKMSAVVISGVKLKLAAFKICACLKVSTTPRMETSAVSFWRPMKSLRSGGITRRKACGITTYRSAWMRVRPRARAARSCDGWIDSMPAR